MQNTEALQHEDKERWQECLECHSMMPVSKGYITWCEHCGWNVQPYDPNPPRNLYETMYSALGKKSGMALFNQVINAKSLSPVWSAPRLLGFATAAAVYLFMLTLLLLGVLLVIGGWGFIVVQMIGLVFIGMASLLRPRLPKIPKENVATRDRFPALYKVVDEVAQAVGASSVDILVLDERFNASFTRVGWRRLKTIYIGLPLFMVLSGQERIALLAHELGHCVNGDLGSHFFVGTAINSLARWYRTLHPGRIWQGGRGRYSFLAVPGNLALLGLAQIAKLGMYVLIHLLWRDMQRAEYMADQLAAQTGGTEAALALLEKLHLSDSVELTTRRMMLNGKEDNLFGVLRHRIETVPEHEKERIRRVERLAASRLDATHPPTVYRVDFLKAHPVTRAKVMLTAEECLQINKELKGQERRVYSAMLDKHLARLY